MKILKKSHLTTLRVASYFTLKYDFCPKNWILPKLENETFWSFSNTVLRTLKEQTRTTFVLPFPFAQSADSKFLFNQQQYFDAKLISLLWCWFWGEKLLMCSVHLWLDNFTDFQAIFVLIRKFICSDFFEIINLYLTMKKSNSLTLYCQQMQSLGTWPISAQNGQNLLCI